MIWVSCSDRITKLKYHPLEMTSNKTVIRDSPGRNRTDVPGTKTRDDGPLHYRTVVLGPYPIHFKCVSPITSLAEAINSDKSRPCESS